jgi:hypothetical protein
VGIFSLSSFTSLYSRYNPDVRSGHGATLARRKTFRQQGRSWMSLLDIIMVSGVVLLIVLIVARRKR